MYKFLPEHKQVCSEFYRDTTTDYFQLYNDINTVTPLPQEKQLLTIFSKWKKSLNNPTTIRSYDPQHKAAYNADKTQTQLPTILPHYQHSCL